MIDLGKRCFYRMVGFSYSIPRRESLFYIYLEHNDSGSTRIKAPQAHASTAEAVGVVRDVHSIPPAVQIPPILHRIAAPFERIHF